MRQRFQRGTGAYHCVLCDKLTRDTGSGEGGTGLCKTCFQISEIENALADNDMTESEADTAIAELRAEQ